MRFKDLLAASSVCVFFAGTAVAGLPGVTIVGKPVSSAQVSFEVALPLRNVDSLNALLTALQDKASPQYHKWLSPAEFASRFGPDAATVARVTAALRASGLSVLAHTQSLRVTGSVAAVESALGTHLQMAAAKTNASHTRLVTDGTMRMPAVLAAAGATVISFGTHEAHTNSRAVTGPLPSGVDSRYGQDGGYWFDDLKQAYSYPSYATMVTVNGKKQRLDGTGATIGALMSSDILPGDIKAVFDHEKFAAKSGMPDPTLFEDVVIDGGGGVDGGAFDEASIDIQSELTGAPGAHVILYNIPDLSDGSVFDGYVTAIEENAVDVLSSSFGECELFYFPAYNNGVDQRGILRAYHALFMQGNAQGITFLASSGDSAGKECTNVAYFTGGPAHFIAGIESPANDPNVTAVGGTNVVTTYLPGSLDSTYATENAWSDPELPYDPYGVGVNATGGVWGAGGGVSKMWPAPAYQKLVTTGSTMRTTPDIGMMVGGCPGGISILNKKTGACDGNDNPMDGSGNTDRSYGIYALAVGSGGGFYGFIGTSLSSPNFAAVLALLVEQQGRQGNINPYLYGLAAAQTKSGILDEYVRTGIPGFNGLIQSNVSTTYNISTGIGTPVVKALVGQPKAASAGLPQTVSNP